MANAILEVNNDFTNKMRERLQWPVAPQYHTQRLVSNLTGDSECTEDGADSQGEDGAHEF